MDPLQQNRRGIIIQENRPSFNDGDHIIMILGGWMPCSRVSRLTDQAIGFLPVDPHATEGS